LSTTARSPLLLDVGQQVTAFLNHDLKATLPEHAPNWQNLPANHAVQKQQVQSGSREMLRSFSTVPQYTSAGEAFIIRHDEAYRLENVP
jgi:hypothetical protein